MGWVRPYFGIESTGAADSKLFESSRFYPDFLPLDRGWCSWRYVSAAD
jgi:hypothetical protein